MSDVVYEPTILKRYTTLSNAIDVLLNERVTLLSPRTWVDRNDSGFMDHYCALKGSSRVSVACFTQSTETYHHWGVFAGGTDGVRLEISKAKLLAGIAGDPAYASGPVRYLTLDEIEEEAGDSRLTADDLPFVKRHGFRDENEFRIVHLGSGDGPPVHHMPIERGWINRISLSPLLPEGLIETMKAALPALPGCADVKVVRSNLCENQRWTRTGESIAL
ncbi:DUF2971 domain-containing protein [Gordonia sp. PP30]|uniref:DUF2971 domain-containing protein n=1 Tax=unclassified Gordonia (in: high G+C Gram-positive bacteria) TaxID=2657482 RepID=UPI001FFF83E4|nr:DUF2971 domain-containing protein [Gordonia sp. PP30]UQE73323.1 DUF2971 domain-containing protein [Gordonia sp. PP30]